MSQILDSVSLHDLTEDHLNSLILRQEHENDRKEYKRELRLSSAADKREFCKDVSAMANSLGGCIFFGVDESNGVAASLAGIEYSEALGQQINQILTSGIVPRVQSISSFPVRLRSGKHVLVLSIGVDGHLHQVKYEDNRCYKRAGTITVPMDSLDIETFLTHRKRGERVEDIINDYYAALRDGRYFKKPEGKALCTICIVPEIASYKLDLSNVQDNFSLRFQPIYASGRCSDVTGKSRFIFDGSRDERTARAVTEVTQLGEVKAYDSCLLNSRRNRLPQGCIGCVPSGTYPDEIIGATHRYLNSLLELGVAPPFFLHTALLNVSGYFLSVQGQDSRILVQDDVLPDTIHVINETQFKSRDDAARILRPSLDFVWREFGFDCCHHYADAGDYRRKPC
jgi:hypothetical protein